MKSKVKILLAVIIIVGLIIGGLCLDHEREMERSRLSGFFETLPTDVSSRVGGRVKRILVHEGDRVQKGQPLIVFEANPAMEQTVESRALVYEAQAKWEEMLAGPRQEDIAKQREIVKQAKANYMELLHGPRPQEIAIARANLAAAEDTLQKTLNGARKEEIEAARANELSAKAHLAALVRGPTQEERNELKAALSAALSDMQLAQKNYARMQQLYAQGAVSKQDLDTSLATLQKAQANRDQADQAYIRACKGTTKEELAQARQLWMQAKYSLDLLLAGSRKEDIQAAQENVIAARQNLSLLLAGTRKEELVAAKAKWREAQVELEELLAGNRREDILQAYYALEAAKAQEKYSSLISDERTLYADTNAIVDRKLVSVGDLISAGAPVLTLENLDDIWIRVYVPEKILSLISVGSPALLKVDGINQTVRAHVESISARGEYTPANLQTPEERGKQVFGVRIRLNHPDSRIKAGMYATVIQLGKWRY
jgi:HlyD family secretion protein